MLNEQLSIGEYFVVRNEFSNETVTDVGYDDMENPTAVCREVKKYCRSCLKNRVFQIKDVNGSMIVVKCVKSGEMLSLDLEMLDIWPVTERYARIFMGENVEIKLGDKV